MKFKKVVASLLTAALLVGGIAIPTKVANREVVASSAQADISGIQDFVTRMYQVCLDRTPDEYGLNDWVNQLVNKSATGCSVAYGFILVQSSRIKTVQMKST